MKKAFTDTARLRYLPLLAALFFFTACSTVPYTREDYAPAIGEIRTIGVSAEIRVLKVSPTGAASMDDISSAARQNAVEAVRAFFKSRGLAVKVIEPGNGFGDELTEAAALSRAVNRSIQNYWDPLMLNYSYSVGSVENLAFRHRVDGLLFVDGTEVYYEDPQPVRKTLAALAIASVYGPPRKNSSRASVTLVNTSGTVVWANYRNNIVRFTESFRDPAKTKKLLESLLDSYPVREDE